MFYKMSASVKVITTESEAGALQMFLVDDPDDEYNAESPGKLPDEEVEGEKDNTHEQPYDTVRDELPEEKASDEPVANDKLPEGETAKIEAASSFDKPSRRSLRLKAGKKPLNYKVNSEDEDMQDTESQLSALAQVKNQTPPKNINSANKSYSCYVCGLRCKTAANLKQHEKTHAEEGKPFVCVHCNYACKRKSDLKKHEETHGPSNAYKCLECDYSGKRLKYLKKHMRIHTRESSFSCHICQYRCLSKSTFDKHLASHSGYDDQLLAEVELKPYTCMQCGEGFERKLALNKHLETHSNNSPFFCVVCGTAFKTKEFLRKHEAQHKPDKDPLGKVATSSEVDESIMNVVKQEHNENSNSSNATILLETSNEVLEKPKLENLSIPRMKGGPIQCPLCIYSCSTKNLLRRHMRRHSDVKPFICTQCGAAFKRKDHLKVHKNTHSNVRPHTCQHCNYSTHRKYRLKLHILTHQTVKPITCPSCEYRCRRYCELKYHMKNKHKVEVEGESEPEQRNEGSDDQEELKCDKCEYTCDSVKRLKYHMTRHDNKTPHSCPHCDYKCSSRSSLSDHLLRHAGLKPCLCSICGAAFRNTSRLNRHKLVHSDIKPYGCDFCEFSSRSKYNLKQHMLRHTDQERTRRRRKPKAPSLFTSAELKTEIIKQSFQADIQPLISQLTSSAYLESMHQQQGANPIFPDQQDPLKLTEHQISLANQLFSRNISDPTMPKILDHGSNSVFGYSTSTANPFQVDRPGMSTTIAQSPALHDAYQQGNSFLSQSNSIPYSPDMPISHPNPSYNYMDRNGVAGYGFASPYFYNETVFPGNLSANMNFYMNPASSSGSLLNSDPVSQSIAQNNTQTNHTPSSTQQEPSLVSSKAAHSVLNMNHKHFSESEYNSHMEDEDMEQRDDVIGNLYNSSDMAEGGLSSPVAPVNGKRSGYSDGSSKPVHICVECGYIGLTKTMLQRHKMTHTNIKPFKCELCDKAFKRRDHMKAHMRTHNSGKPFSCSLCSFTCNRKYSLTIHEKTHTNENLYDCSLCESTFSGEVELEEHMKIHKDGNMFMCDKCDFKCLDVEELKSHSEGHKTFLCEQCSYVCRSSREFASHKKMHEDKEEMTCPVCNFTCDSQKRLKYHMERHDNKTPLTCPHCDYKCSSRSSLSDHLLQHEGLKPFLCSECGMSFRNVSRLNRHKLTHTDIKPHSCDYCPFSSRSRYNLKQHMSRHFK